MEHAATSLGERRAAVLEALCETIVPGSSRVGPVVYIDAVLGRMDEGGRAAAIAAIDSLAEVADGGPGALRPLANTPEFMLVRALAIEAYYSDFVAPGVDAEGAWREIGFNSPLATRLNKDWSYLGVVA
ncbi:MAG: hypothetical protein GEU88_06975 [Solirubrobacterales bacterium]|nr:hypothetical protein [Solirubrobacterales bacterium]